MKVTNMTSPNGLKVANQFIINDNGKMFFQSYNSIIAMINNDGKIYLDNYYWDYSVTTSKYRNIFLNEKKPVTEKKIKDGLYTLTNLNEDK
jgi:hypothetical protein|tara:strand:+ start:292 stop:564 length:273 start_codon:yes stop_codon:yes gene_type:complete